jgi:hypothetical protein
MGFELGIGDRLLLVLQFYRNHCSASRRALDLKMAPEGLSAFVHIEHSEVPCRTRVIRTEAATVVPHSQYHFLRTVLQFNLNRRCVAVFDGVRDSFLADAQEIHLESSRQPHRSTAYLNVDPGFVAGA